MNKQTCLVWVKFAGFTIPEILLYKLVWVYMYIYVYHIICNHVKCLSFSIKVYTQFHSFIRYLIMLFTVWRQTDDKIDKLDCFWFILNKMKSLLGFFFLQVEEIVSIQYSINNSISEPYQS